MYTSTYKMKHIDVFWDLSFHSMIYILETICQIKSFIWTEFVRRVKDYNFDSSKK